MSSQSMVGEPRAGGEGKEAGRKPSKKDFIAKSTDYTQDFRIYEPERSPRGFSLNFNLKIIY